MEKENLKASYSGNNNNFNKKNIFMILGNVLLYVFFSMSSL